MRSPRLPGLALSAAAAWALVLAPATRARADVPLLDASSGDVAAAVFETVAHLFLLGVYLSDADRGPERADRGQYDGWDGNGSRRPGRDARQGFLFSFGLGGGSMLVSPVGRSGAFQGNLRLGYGFSDRFQMFFDVTGAGANYGKDLTSTSVLATIRGQTVLIGDRRGNGLNFNLGVGVAGNTKSYGGLDINSPAGVAVAGGLSVDLRVSRQFALSPELFGWWHAVPNDRGRERDISTAVGLQLNFLWYGP